MIYNIWYTVYNIRSIIFEIYWYIINDMLYDMKWYMVWYDMIWIDMITMSLGHLKDFRFTARDVAQHASQKPNARTAHWMYAHSVIPSMMSPAHSMMHSMILNRMARTQFPVLLSLFSSSRRQVVQLLSQRPQWNSRSKSTRKDVVQATRKTLGNGWNLHPSRSTSGHSLQRMLCALCLWQPGIPKCIRRQKGRPRLPCTTGKLDSVFCSNVTGF